MKKAAYYYPHYTDKKLNYIVFEAQVQGLKWSRHIQVHKQISFLNHETILPTLVTLLFSTQTLADCSATFLNWQPFGLYGGCS